MTLAAQQDRPLGAFDSGVGGLTVVREILTLLPHENLLYLADSANCPYGPRSDEEVRDLARQCTDFLVERGAKLVVVACNTASAAGLTHLRARYSPDIEIVGLVPAVKPAVLATRTGRIGVLATPGTLRGTLLNDVIAQHAAPAGVEVFTAAPDGLVEAIEAGEDGAEETRRILERSLAPLLAQHVDVLVLGCTHYPLVANFIHEIAGPGIQLVDSGGGVARRTRQLLATSNLLARRSAMGTLQLFTSGNPEQVAPLVSRLLRQPTRVFRATF